jgi:hypothetical protein
MADIPACIDRGQLDVARRSCARKAQEMRRKAASLVANFDEDIPLMKHRFHFFRAGGVDQVSLRDRADLLALDQLDRKLWVALAMPTTGVDIDPETLVLLDHDKDNRIRVDDILDAVKWADKTFVDLDKLLVGADHVELKAIKDEAIVNAAKRMLGDLGKGHETRIGVADTVKITEAFATTVLNGDGIVIPAAADDANVRRAIEDAIACVGSAIDRSGKPGIDADLAASFFADVDKRAAWIARGSDAALSPIGDRSAAAADALAAVKDKIEDFFTRCRIAAYDPRGAAALAGQDVELVALAARTLSGDDAEVARFPLAKIDATVRLPLHVGINPAWSARMATFVAATVEPVLGKRDVLTTADFAAIVERLSARMAWNADKPATKVDGLDVAWIGELAKPELRAAIAKLVDADKALAAEYDSIGAVAKAVRMQRDFGRILRNFVSFSDFYSRQDGVFQAGTLYLDARAMHLCVPVTDAGKHGALAASSDACLLYCDIKRGSETRQIAAALTNGDTDSVGVGRNGVFYDRDDNDWDATITKIVSNPVSVRQAFWSPYKKLVKTIEDNVQKRAAAAEAESMAKVEAAGTKVAHVDKAVAAAAAAPPPAAAKPADPPKKLDLGTVAAIGVAIGGIGTLFGVVMSSLFGLGVWIPLGIIGLLLMISGPSMLLAWLKLRRRNLGPILDANGWAINGHARINVAFGAAMTELAKLPPGAKRSTKDPFADKRRPWKLYIFLLVLVGLAAGWYFGKLDKYLPSSARSTTILGANAPAYVAPSKPVEGAPTK